MVGAAERRLSDLLGDSLRRREQDTDMLCGTDTVSRWLELVIVIILLEPLDACFVSREHLILLGLEVDNLVVVPGQQVIKILTLSFQLLQSVCYDSVALLLVLAHLGFVLRGVFQENIARRVVISRRRVAAEGVRWEHRVDRDVNIVLASKAPKFLSVVHLAAF